MTLAISEALSSAAIAATEIHYQKLDPSLWLERTPTSAFIAYCVHIFFGVANLFLCPCNFTIFSFSFKDKTVWNFKKHTHVGTWYAWPLALAKWKLAGRGEPLCLEGHLMILLRRIHCIMIRRILFSIYHKQKCLKWTLAF